MKTETLKALRASIAHWKRMRKNRDSTQEDPSAEHCALCLRFYTDMSCKLDGERCPVAGPEGKHDGCRDTPFYKARVAFHYSNEKTWQAAATAEIKFLESLLPRKKAVKASDEFALSQARGEEINRAEPDEAKQKQKPTL